MKTQVVAIYLLLVVMLMLLLFAVPAATQTIFNTVAVTSNGQFVNAQLTDNVYVDMSTSPPKLRAKRPVFNIRPVEQPDNTWLIPSAVQLPAGYQLQIIVNGLNYTEGVDYRMDLANPRRIIPTATKWHYIDAAANDAGPYLVKVNLFP